MKIIEHEPPKLNRPSFKVDGKLSKYLDENPLLKHMNKRFICCSCGKPGSGKTTHIISLLTTERMFKKVFHKIYVFMPSTSRDSLKNNIFNELPEDQLFEGVDEDNLSNLYQTLLDNTEQNKKSLLIFDDVQSYLKNPKVERILLHICANSRHLRCSIIFAIQNYNKISLAVRKNFTDMFLFNPSKKELENIYEEHLDLDKNEFQELLKHYNKIKNQEDHSFLYCHIPNQTFFINWNEIVFTDDD
jgi:hypothetical protein